MKLPHRRQFLHLAAGAAALPAASRIARAQTYPTRPVRIMVGFPPGGGADIVARLMAQWLSERLGQQFIVENRPGAAGNIAVEGLVRAPPDGYTLAIINTNNSINAALYDKLSFNLIRDIIPVAGLTSDPMLVVISPSVAARTVPEFIAYAKANPGKINMASGGNGSVQHVAGELFRMMAGVDFTHVPYRGAGPALTDLIGGQVHVMFDVTTSSIEHIRSGQLRALAVTTATRVQSMPDIPSVSETVPGYEVTGNRGIGVPKNTPADIIDKLNKEINAGLSDPKMVVRIAELGGAPLTGSSADFGRLLTQEVEKWGKVVKFAGLKAE
jgi:tripartite-type tricarboxylate transporter receptor subunit TctC